VISLNEFKEGVSKILMLDREVPGNTGTRVLKYLRAVLIIGVVLGVSVVSVLIAETDGDITK
jgi:hypothetical protein